MSTDLDQEVATRALEYLERHHCMSVATDGPEGLWAATVFYVNDGFTLHFQSLSDSRHARNIEANPHVAVTISEDAESWPDIGGIQLEGSVVRADRSEDRRQTLELFSRRYPFVDSLWWSDAPPAPGAERRYYRIEPTRIFFVDHGVRIARSPIAQTELRR